MSDLSANPQYVVVRDVCARLEGAGIPYMLTGSMALCYFAQPRFTRDIDVVVDIEPQDAASFARLFSPEYFVDEDAVRMAASRQGMFNMLHTIEAFKVDCIVRKKTILHHTQFARRVHVQFNGIDAWIVSKEDLIVAKLLWAKDSFSETQLRDVKNLLDTGCDDDYVNRWVSTLKLEPVYEKAKKA
jgi:hypothetical protein